MRTVKQLLLALTILLGLASSASADSIQRAGLTMGIPEGYGRTPGFYVASMLDFGLRSSTRATSKRS